MNKEKAHQGVIIYLLDLLTTQANGSHVKIVFVLAGFHTDARSRAVTERLGGKNSYTTSETSRERNGPLIQRLEIERGGRGGSFDLD